MTEPTEDRPDEMSDEPNTELMTYADPEPFDDESGYDDVDEFGDDSGLPGRPRRVLVNRYSTGLVIVLVGAACFYGGVRVEKSQVGTSSGSAASAFSSRFAAAAGGTTRSGFASRRSGSASGTSASGTSAPGTSGTSASTAGGFPGGGAGGFGAAGSGTEGTISSIAGDTLYITETSGNTVKVKLSSATTLTKTVSVSKRSLYPGDTVSVSGSTSGSTVTATSVADSGDSSTSSSTSGTSSATGSSSSTSGSTGLSSLFGG